MPSFYRTPLVLGCLAWFCTLSGCATTWSKSGGSAEALSADQQTCGAEANAAFPPNIVKGQPRVTPPHNQCEGLGADRRCILIQGSTVEAQTDLNQSSREQAVAQCMSRLGWTKN